MQGKRETKTVCICISCMRRGSCFAENIFVLLLYFCTITRQSIALGDMGRFGSDVNGRGHEFVGRARLFYLNNISLVKSRFTFVCVEVCICMCVYNFLQTLKLFVLKMGR